MATTPLRRFLQSLCDNSCWNYAVFWKLHQQSQMLLKWEEGYFGTLKVDNSMEDMFVEPSFGGLEETSSCNAYNGTLGGDTVELAVAYMSTFQYTLGDGVVGDVAYTGNCRWVFAGSKSLGEFNTISVPEHADEWLFQFAAGVKTILLVPVIPHGVLQLGSLEDIPEDAQMANYIKNDFFTHQDFIRYSDPFSTNQPDFINWSNHKPLTKSLVTPTCDNLYLSHLAETNNRKLSMTHLVNSESQPLVSDVGPFLSFPKECELHKALGPVFTVKSNDVADSSSRKINGTHFREENVKNVRLGDNSCIQTSGESSRSNSFGQFAYLAKRKNINDSSSPSGISYEGVVDDELTENNEQKGSYDIMYQSKGSKPSIARKGRGKHGAKQKTRPRDRQLIQDRLKDLRELVPEGAKCSIDGLLDRTVKHMLFLESVSDRAIKLKQCVQPEGMGTGPKNNIKPEVNRSQNGASWAFELGGDLNVCPILVEDLQCPGHMIIEMICDESNRFLEIAEVIHGLDLTILNGVMEKRSGNTWARYIVEAPRGFHRLDIFWPLMKLLQQQHSPLSSKI